MQENFNSAVRSMDRAAFMLRYDRGLDIPSFAELPKNSHLTGQHFRDLFDTFRIFFSAGIQYPFVDPDPEISRTVILYGSSEKKFPNCWPSRYRQLTQNSPGFWDWAYDENYNYVQVFRQEHALQPEFPLAFTEEPTHCTISRCAENLAQLRECADLLGRLPLPESWCRNVTFRREENSGSYRDQEPQVYEYSGEAQGLPSPGFREYIYFSRNTDYAGYWYGGYYETQYVVSYVKNPTPVKVSIRLFFADVPEVSTSGYFVLDPGPSDYTGFSVPSIPEQDRLVTSGGGFYPADSVSAVTYQTLEMELEPGEERKLPGSPESLPSVLRDTFYGMIADGTADNLSCPPYGVRGMSRQVLLADWRML